MSERAWLDVLNAGVWVLIVAILELEIYLKSSKLVGTKFFITYKAFKGLLYLILVVDVFYWWWLDAPWDAWDAFLWLVAFFFIEMTAFVRDVDELADLIFRVTRSVFARRAKPEQPDGFCSRPIE